MIGNKVQSKGNSSNDDRITTNSITAELGCHGYSTVPILQKRMGAYVYMCRRCFYYIMSVACVRVWYNFYTYSTSSETFCNIYNFGKSDTEPCK